VRVGGIANSSSEGRPFSLVSGVPRTLPGSRDQHKHPLHGGWTDVKLFCGIDWAEGHHDGDGQLVSKKRISDDPAGFAKLIELLTADGGRGRRASA
jgi:hypothetical protein